MGPMASTEARQCWIGSTPGDLPEEAVIEQLRAYEIRPFRLRLRTRCQGQDRCEVSCVFQCISINLHCWRCEAHCARACAFARTGTRS